MNPKLRKIQYLGFWAKNKLKIKDTLLSQTLKFEEKIVVVSFFIFGPGAEIWLSLPLIISQPLGQKSQN